MALGFTIWEAREIDFQLRPSSDYTYGIEPQLKKRDKEPKDQDTAGRYPYKD